MDSDAVPPRLSSAYSAIEAANDVASSLLIIQNEYEIDFVTYHLAQTMADIVDDPFVRTTYSDAWVSRYLLQSYVKIDPIVQQGFLRQLPFDWRDVEPSEAASQFMMDANRHGIGASGFSIPIASGVRRALLSLNSHASPKDWSETIARDQAEWIELAHLVHRKALSEIGDEIQQLPALSPRELQCLHWSALGNDAKGISLILGLSEHTTRTYLKSARFKLSCLTITAASARATQLRLINPYGNTPI